MEKLTSYSRFVKIEHTLFSFPLLVAGALLAQGELTIRVFVLILVAGTGARTAALALNRILDRTIDQFNPRTASRELPSGSLSLGEASAIAFLGAGVFLAAAYLISTNTSR